VHVERSLEEAFGLLVVLGEERAAVKGHCACRIGVSSPSAPLAHISAAANCALRRASSSSPR
jgi:hypothetical protein